VGFAVANGVFHSLALSTPLAAPEHLSSLVYAATDRTNVFGLIFFLLAWHVAIYCPVAHILWHPNGYLLRNDVQDFAGGAVVHLLASATILAAHLFLNRRGAPNYAVKIPNNVHAAFRSVLLVWFLWLGVNAGKAHDAGPVAAQAMVNTIASVQTALLVGYALDRAYDTKLANSAVSMLSHILLGLVGITAGCGYTTAGGAMITAVATVVVTKLVARYALDDGIVPHDPLDILTIHGIGGTVGFVMTGVTSFAFINPEGADGLINGAQHLIRMQVAAALALWACSVAAVLALLFLCDYFVPLSYYTDTERVMSPTITYIPPPPVKTAKPIGGGAADMQGGSGGDSSAQAAVEREELEREVSLYRKISTYFSRNNSSLSPR
jgi:Amt family ammonium transporter